MTGLFKHPIALVLCLSVAGCDNAEAPKPTQPQPQPQPQPGDKKPETPGVSGSVPVVADSGSKPVADPKPVETTPPAEPPSVEIPEKLVLDTARPVLTFADAATKAAAAELAKKVDGLKFPYDLVKIEANALPFLHLAHTADDVGLATAALSAIATRYSERESSGRRKVDADYHAVVAYRLVSDDPYIQTAAFEAAQDSAEVVPPDAKVIGILVDLAYHHESLSGRFAALDVLRHAKVATGEIQAAFEHALTDKSPMFLALTLDAMSYMGKKMARRDVFERTVAGFTKHPEASVRGGAVAILGNLSMRTSSPELDERIVKVILPLLDDPASSVRAQAAHAMGTMRRVEVAAKLVELLDDTGSASIELDGWTKLDGSADRPSLGVSMSRTVGSVAVMAMSLLSTTTDAAFKYAQDVVYDGRGGSDYGPAIKKTKDWYAANKDKLRAD